MKAIVTGANGFVGSATIRKLVSMGISVLAIDIPNNFSNLDFSTGMIEYRPLFVENIEEIKSSFPFGEYDLFYHFAWRGSAGNLRVNPEVQVNNALATVKCLTLANEIGCKKFIVAGSIMEYEVLNVMYSQGTKPDLNYIYGVGKQTAHSLCKPIANKLGIELIWSYITNAYGVGELSPRFLNTTLRKIIHSESLEFTSATQNYDFVYIDDVAEAFYLLGIRGKGNYGYMIGSGNAQPLKQFISETIHATETKIIPHFGNVPYSGVDLPLSVFSIDEMTKIGFIPKITFSNGVRLTYEWLKKEDERK